MIPRHRARKKPTANDPVLRDIEKDIFRGLGQYGKCFPDLDLWQLSRAYDARQDEGTVRQAMERALLAAEGFLLYIHLPFCFERCVFCNTFPLRQDKTLQETYCSHLLKEAALFAQTEGLKKKKVLGVYLGGGTPTCFSAAHLAEMLDTIRTLFDLEADATVTCEMHPLHGCGRAGEKTLAALKRAGVNRVSMGVQTFDPGTLSHCDRHHTAEDILAAVDNVRAHQLAHNLDMMVGLPGQTVDTVKNDLSVLSAMGPDAVEYMRHGVVNPRVVKRYRERPDLVTARDVLFRMNGLCHRWMRENGYEQNGSFSPGSRFFPYRSLWLTETPYLALGAMARSHFGEMTFTKSADLNRYFSLIDRNRLPIDGFRSPGDTEKLFRTLLLRLQLAAGIEWTELIDRYGKDALEPVRTVCNTLKKYHLVSDAGGSIRLTDAYGRFFVEDICQLIALQAGRCTSR